MAASLRFGPNGVAASRLELAGLGWFVPSRLATGRTTIIFGRPVHPGSLPCQRLLEHFLRQDLAYGRDGRFQFGELGSPGQTVGSVETLDQVFGHALDVGNLFVYS